MVRALGTDDADAYAALRRDALTDSPLAFGASPADDFAASPDAIRDQLRRAPDWVVLGAFQDGLVGALGLFRDRHVKSSHKIHLWGMYVAPSHRRQGIGGDLLQAALQHARALGGVAWVHLAVTSAAPGARRLYERAGFEVWGTEPDALRHAGQAVVEHHMALHLGEGARLPLTSGGPLRLQSFYPIVVTEHLTACRDFYRRWFRLEVTFEASWFILLSAGEAGPASLAFMHPGHPSAPPGPERFNGQGMCLEFQVEDARVEHARFAREGAPITLSLRDEPFGQRRFGLFDPAGVWIDVVEQIEPAAGWWDQYLV